MKPPFCVGRMRLNILKIDRKNIAVKYSLIPGQNQAFPKEKKSTVHIKNMLKRSTSPEQIVVDRFAAILFTENVCRLLPKRRLYLCS